MDLWLGNKKRILVLNREDMISTADRNAWAAYFGRHGTKAVFSNGQLGMVSKQYFFPRISVFQRFMFSMSDPMLHVQGTMKLGRLVKELAADVNVKRRAKGLLPRAVSCL